MRQPLTPREQSVLRGLGKQIRQEDPELAAQLERPGVAAAAKFSPRYWSSSVYAMIGICFLMAGIVLSVGSAVLGGLCAIGIAIYRSPFTCGLISGALALREDTVRRRRN